MYVCTYTCEAVCMFIHVMMYVCEKDVCMYVHTPVRLYVCLYT